MVRVLVLVLAAGLAGCASTRLATEPVEAHHDGEHGHSHHVTLFLGNTRAHGEDGFTVGADYEYRLSRLAGIGAFVDRAEGHHDTTIVGPALFVHPYGHWRLLVAPAVENEGSENQFLLRAGLAYEFEVGEWTIAPTLNVDFVDGEESSVFGLSIGHGF